MTVLRFLVKAEDSVAARKFKAPGCNFAWKLGLGQVGHGEAARLPSADQLPSGAGDCAPGATGAPGTFVPQRDIVPGTGRGGWLRRELQSGSIGWSPLEGSISVKKLLGTAMKDTELLGCSSSPRRSSLKGDLEACSVCGSRGAISAEYWSVSSEGRSGQYQINKSRD